MMSLQDPYELEPPKAYQAYLLHRNQGLGRTLTSSYNLYLDETNSNNSRGSGRVGTSKPSPNYQKWVKEYNWDERVADWDNTHQQRIQAALIEADVKGYQDKIQQLVCDVEAFATEILSGSMSLAKAAKIRADNILRSTIAEGEYLTPMERDTASEYKTLSGVFQSAIGVLHQATELKSTSLGLETTIKQLKELNEKQ